MTEIICIFTSDRTKANKETVAKMLREELEKEEQRVLITRFADPLKHICRNWFHWNGRMDDTGRSLLQYIGTDVVRARLPDFWVDYTLNLLSIMGDEWDYVIIPDCSWPNEFDLERYGFQPRYLCIDGKGASDIHNPKKSPGPAIPDFIIASSESPEQLRIDVADVAQRLIYG